MNLDTLHKIATEQLGKVYQCLSSDNKEYNLCFSDDDPLGDPLRKVYIVIDSQGSIVVPQGRIHGTIKWINDTQIELTEYSRVLDKRGNTDPRITLINVNSIEN